MCQLCFCREQLLKYQQHWPISWYFYRICWIELHPHDHYPLQVSLFEPTCYIYLAISPSQSCFVSLSLSAHQNFSHIPTQHYTFKSCECTDNLDPSLSLSLSLTHTLSFALAKWMLKAYKVSLHDAEFHCSSTGLCSVLERVFCPGSVMWCTFTSGKDTQSADRGDDLFYRTWAYRTGMCYS